MPEKITAGAVPLSSDSGDADVDVVVDAARRCDNRMICRATDAGLGILGLMGESVSLIGFVYASQSRVQLKVRILAGRCRELQLTAGSDP
jgi:hypothetical protein